MEGFRSSIVDLLFLLSRLLAFEFIHRAIPSDSKAILVHHEARNEVGMGRISGVGRKRRARSSSRRRKVRRGGGAGAGPPALVGTMRGDGSGLLPAGGISRNDGGGSGSGHGKVPFGLCGEN